MNFERWWFNIGSGITKDPSNDCYEHAYEVSEKAWVASAKDNIGDFIEFLGLPKDIVSDEYLQVKIIEYLNSEL